MDASQIYIAVSIVALAITALVAFFVRKKKVEKITPLAALAFAFVVAGIIFGNDRLIGYGLMGIGVAFAIIDIILKSKKK